MGLESRSVTRGLIIAVSLLLVGGVAAAVTNNDDDNDRLEAGASTTSSTAAAGAAAAGGEDAKGSGTGGSAKGAGAGGAAGSSAGAGAGGSAAPANPAATFTPPLDGIYHYKAESDGKKDEDVERTVRTTSKSNGDVRQSIGGQFDGNSGDLRIVWKADGWTWEGISAEGQGQSGDCTFSPPLHYLPQPVAVGNTWSYDSSCTFTFGAQTATVRISGTAKVAGTGKADVGGTSVDVWIIERSGDYEVSFGVNKTSATSTSTEQWAPAHGLDVRSTSTVKSEAGEQTQTRYLTSLKPEKP